MLPILRPRTILHTSRFLRTRLFTTVPRKIPPHIKRWDPTLYAPNRSQEAQAVSAVDCRDQELLYRSERERLRDTQRVEVLAKSNQDNAVHNFNQLLLLSNQRSNRDPELWKPLWEAYTHGKRNVRGFLYFMTARAWDIMWITQNAYARHSQSLRRLRKLYRDMDSFLENPTVGERVQSLEALYGKGMKEQALKEWQDDRNNHDGLRHDYKPEHLEVGVRLHALAGNLDYAQSIMEELFHLYPSWDSSIMMTVFRAHTSRKLGQDHHVAKELYVKMKSTMGMNSSLEHYDSWFIGFLEAGHIQHAKLVLTDMVKDGKIAHSYSPEHVHEVLKRLHLLYRLGTDISKMTSIALHAITVLPKPYHSHVFGDWMKNTVVQKAPEAAAQILDMMFHRGYKPETYHFNMLLRALFRTKEKPHILKAENIGWRMIDEARKLSLPKHKSTPRTISEAVGENAKLADDVDNAETKPNVPPADASTFTLIMRYHGERLQWEHVDYLSRQLKQSNVRPNAPLMNIIIDNLCRQGKYREAWKVYESFTRPSEGTQGVFPNGASFRHLWKTLRLALGDKATRDDPKLPSPRALLAETVRWWTMCQSRFDADRFLQGLSAASRRAIQGLIMHCFSYTQDLPGSLVALHVLSKNFGIFPDLDAVEILQKHIAWIDMGAESRSVGSQHHHHIRRLNNQNIERMKRVYDILTEGRLNRMSLTKDQYAQMNFEEAKEIRLNLLSEFVRVTLKRHSSPQQVEAMIDAAKLSVGVPDMCTGDLDAFAVS